MQPYQTISGSATASITEKKSEFIAHAAFVQTEQEAQEVLAFLREEHRTARHNVYAYLLREGMRTRYSDDGEPSKTAGLPVLEVLQHSGLTDIIMVVTRYFGGILLGTGGLVRAYTQAAQAALQAAQIVTVMPCVRIDVQIDYSFYDKARQVIEAAGAKTENAVFGTGVQLTLLLLQEQAPVLSTQLTELTSGRAKLQMSEPFYTAF